MLIPVRDLLALCEYPDDWTGREALFADLDENGMREPLGVMKMDALEWANLPPCHPKLVRPPPWLCVFTAVKQGNQRLAWAKSRGIEEVECVFI